MSNIKISTKDKDEWLNFTLSFLNIATSPILNIKGLKNDELRKIIDDYYIAIIFNIKHGIESFIKSLIVLLEERELEKNRQHHDTVKNFDYILSYFKEKSFEKKFKEEAKKHEGEELYEYVNKNINKLPEMHEKASKLILKYQSLSFLREKISTDYDIEDLDNTAFKYPQNNLKVKLNYAKILSRVTEIDLLQISMDTADLKLLLMTYSLFFEAYLGKD